MIVPGAYLCSTSESMSVSFHFRLCFLFFVVCAVELPATGQIDPAPITIARDAWGVPHIFAPTDPQVAYGLAWAHAEDDFPTIQEPLLAVQGRLSEVKGKNGVLLDAIAFFADVEGAVETQFDSVFSPEYKALLNGYVQGLNAFAAAHPDEIRASGLFPTSERELVKAYIMTMMFISNVHYDLIRILQNTIVHQEAAGFHRGSNGWAFAPHKTETGETYLVSNTHQPLRGPTSWYEAHVQSEEGWDMLGATFPAGVTPFLGTNRYLGWTHTTNYDDFDDVYKLVMHPKKKWHYRYDGKWKALEKRVLKLKVKFGPVKIPVKRTFYWSVYGPALKNKHGFYAIRFVCNQVITAGQQWYAMNKARNFTEFEAALKRQSLPNQNVIYADRDGRIAFLGNGLFPYRATGYNWQGVVPGDTSATNWPLKFLPLDSLIYVRDPECGYVFNCNHTSYNCTCPAENPRPEDYNPRIGYQPKNTARAIRVGQFMAETDKISYARVKEMKYDSRIPLPLYTRSIENLDLLRSLDPARYPDLREVLAVLTKWDGSAEVDNEQAAIISLAIQHLLKYIRGLGIAEYNNTLPEEEFAEALRFAQKHLRKHFGTLEVPLGDLQKHVRGEQVMGIWGIPEVLTQMYTKPWEDGRYQSELGDSYTLFVTYDAAGVKRIETVVPYGASNRPGDPHYADQMSLFVNKQLKTMSMDRTQILDSATRIYHPK